MKQKSKQVLIWLVGVIGLVLADQAVKEWAIHQLKGQPAIPVWPGVFELSYVENRGAAFGILQNQRWLFTILTVLILIGLAYAYFRLWPEKKFRLTRICCIVVAAGAIGNLLDRLNRHYVVDLFYFKLIDFPVFNVADCYVVVFGILFCLAALFQKGLLEDLGAKLARRKERGHRTDL